MGCKSKAGKRRSSSPVQRRTGSFRTPVQGGGVGDSIVCVCVCLGHGREQSHCPEKVTAGGEGRGLQLVPDALRS